MGESRRSRPAEVAAVRQAIELGYRLIDTAEMYGEGGAEESSARRWRSAARRRGRREDVFIVSKVYPHNASRIGTPAACERSLARLGSTPSISTCCTGAAAPAGGDGGRVRGAARPGPDPPWGVSNFDTDDMEALWRVARRRALCRQPGLLLAHRARGRDDLLPWLQARRAADGVFAHRPGRSWPVSARSRHGRTPRLDAGPGGACLVPVATRRDRDPEGGPGARTCAKTWRRRELELSAGERPNSIAAFRPRARRRRSSMR